MQKAIPQWLKPCPDEKRRSKLRYYKEIGTSGTTNEPALTLDGEAEAGFAAVGVGAIFEVELAAMGFGDLAAEDQSNARAARFGGEEGNEDVGRVGDARAVIHDPNFQEGAVARPADVNAAARFERGVHSVADEIDEELLQLIFIGGDGYGWPLL